MSIEPTGYVARTPQPLSPEGTLIAVIEMGRDKWLVSAVVPGLDRRPIKVTLERELGVMKLLAGWRSEVERGGAKIDRVVVAYEAGRDGFVPARVLRQHGLETYVIHPASVAVRRGHGRAKTDRLDTQMLLRALCGWLRDEPDACTMVGIPSIAEEDLRRPGRERAFLVRDRTAILNRIRGLLALHGINGITPRARKAWQSIQAVRTPEGRELPPAMLAELRRCFARLQLLDEQIREIERQRECTQTGPSNGEALAPAALAVPAPVAGMVAQLAAIKGLGLETAHTLVHELLLRPFRDRRALARFVGLTGTPDQSGTRRRDRGLARAGNPRLRQLLVQLAWRLLQFQPDAGLVQWYRRRVEQANGAGRKTFIVALARKALIALWRYLRDGVAPQGFVLGATR